MRIAFVMPYDLAHPGGVRTHTLALAGWLRRQGCDAHVIAPSSDPEAAREPWLHPVGHPLRIPIGGSVGNLAFGIDMIPRVRDLLREDWDIVHIQEPLVPPLGLLALRYKADHARTVLTFHSAERTAHRLYRAAAPLLRPYAALADARIVVSTAALDAARPILGGPAAIIPPCIETVAPGPATNADPAAILFVGRDEPRKGLSTLLRALARKKNAQPTLHIAGTVRPATRKLVQQLGLADRVVFHGPQSSEGVRELLGRAALFCAPALGGEALGLVLVEAMAAGVPVVASDIDGYRIPARDGRAALLAPPGDAAALADAIARALADQPLRERLAAAGRASARRFHAQTVGAEHLRVYNRLLS